MDQAIEFVQVTEAQAAAWIERYASITDETCKMLREKIGLPREEVFGENFLKN